MKRFQNILFARSAGHNEIALAHAVALAARNKAGLTFVETAEEIPDSFVSGLPGETVERIKKAALDDAQKGLLELARVDDEPVEAECRVVEGIRFLTIIREVLRNGHDLVIKSAEGTEGPLSHLFGTTDMHLLRKCPCPLWLVKPHSAKAITRIIAAVDFDQPGESGENDALNKQIMEMALSLAHEEGAELHVIHAWQAIGENVLSSGRTGLPQQEVEEYIEDIGASRRRRLAELIKQARGWVGEEMFDAIKPATYAIKGRAQQVIVKQSVALEADLIVMGTVGRVGIPGFFIGNTAETILNRITCSVLAVKPDGFVSPVTL